MNQVNNVPTTSTRAMLPTTSTNVGIGKIEKELMEMRVNMQAMEQRLKTLEDPCLKYVFYVYYLCFIFSN